MSQSRECCPLGLGQRGSGSQGWHRQSCLAAHPYRKVILVGRGTLHEHCTVEARTVEEVAYGHAMMLLTPGADTSC